MNKKNILIVTRSYDQNIGGMETHTRLIIEKLVSSGHNVTVITPELAKGSKSLFYINNITVYRISKMPNLMLKYSLSFWLAVRSFIKCNHNKYDHILNVSMATGFVNAALIKKYKLDIITVLHGTYQLERRSLVSQFFVTRNRSIKTLLGIPYCFMMQIIQNKVVFNSKKIISASTIITDDLKIIYRNIDRKITTIRNFIDNNQFAYVERNYNEKKSLNFLYVGRLHKEKGIDMIIMAVDEFERKKISYTLIIVGDGDMFPGLKNLVKDNKRIKLVGAVSNDEVVEYLDVSDIFLFPTKRTGEGMSISVLEAMSVGIIVIAPDILSMKELFVDKEDGLIFKLGNQQDFEEKIFWCFDNLKKLNIISANASKKIECNHSLSGALNLIENEIIA